MRIEKNEPLGHVIQILDKFTLIVDTGKPRLSIGDSIQVYQLGDPIYDLNGNELCKYVFVKDTLRVIDVQDKYSVCKKDKNITKKTSPLLALSPLLEATYTEKEALHVSPTDIKPLSNIDPQIVIGDFIKLA